ncbi:putative superfamily III holin-X [Actinomadura pelletieri DSM 43383]|uniref:Putative superfamily III holin-X n=1 Tax=Actinomadura pelletieri DSM 43383 TaxID=1120940 RepID=A0A495QYP5_9ACTN|nr:phage holin family protein [Actinomadura pelletieri]RKS79177.1 putative superfamily III holin-X [Actinomadura pelletieri DSM 43383]
MSEAVPDERVEDKSLGELVALALSDVSDTIKLEMELAKVEFKADAKKAAVSSVMFTIAAVMGGIVVILLSISLAYGLIGLGLWRWAAFLTVAVVYVILALVLMLVAKRFIKKIEGAKRTRKTLKDDLAKLRRGGDSDVPELTE